MSASTAGQGDEEQASAALEKLCRAYWYPLYAFVRRRGSSPEDAQDLTQGFFAHLLRRDFLRGVGPGKGRFRSFLLACLKHFLTDEWEKARTAKRGGECPERLLDLESGEARYQLETRVAADPENLYERRWALDLLDRVLDRLRQDAVASGREAVFDQLQGCLLGERLTETYAQLGTRLGLSETAVKVTVHRLRQRYRELLGEAIAHTVTRALDVSANGTDWLSLGAGTRISGGWQWTNVSVSVGNILRARGFVSGGAGNASSWFVETNLLAGTPFIAWLQHYGLPADGSADYLDLDADGRNNWQEWRCQTDPTNALSVLRLLSASPAGTNVAVTWQSVAGLNYFLERSTNLSASAPFTQIAPNLPGQAGTTTYTDTNAASLAPLFYRVRVTQ